jgi:hypothetical protein
MIASNEGMALLAPLFFFAVFSSGLQDDLLAAKLEPQTVKAWDQYVQWADGKVAREIAETGRFLIGDRLSPKDRKEYDRRLKEGQVYVAQMSGVIPPNQSFKEPGGEIHHWWAAVLVPKMKLADLITTLQDYDDHAGKFTEVERSKLRSKSGDTYWFYFRLKRKKAVVTAYYNTEQQCTYHPLGPDRLWSRSMADRIAELKDPGTSKEQELPPGNDRGFLWRLVSWWRFQQTPDGVIVECESASLSRNLPALASLVPGLPGYIRATAKESLESMLLTIRGFGTSK